jgi:O-antigen/teichoic acid export membrane protein
MIRATAISVVDQGLLSAVNFLLALVLIRFASPEEYGLYTQLIGLQALFSALHAGLFVSAFLSVLPRLQGAARAEYRAGMARAELVVTFTSMVFVAAATWLIAAWLGHPITLLLSAAAAAALLSLWWREFVRAGHFAGLEPLRVLRVDAAYALLVLIAVTGVVAAHRVTAVSMLWCIGIAGAAVTVVPILRKARESRVDVPAVRANLSSSWQSARWEVMTSLLTWGHAQTFVYFAAAQGGLRAAAQISAARLLTMPLSLVWSSYANILRPSASRLLDAPEAGREIALLARRSVFLVLVMSGGYAAVLAVTLPLLDSLLFAGKFEGLSSLTWLWLAYFSLTGMTTIAASVLRSALEFRSIFAIQATCAAIAVLASFAGLAFGTSAAFIQVLIGVELLLAILLWRRLRDYLSPGIVPAVRET